MAYLFLFAHWCNMTPNDLDNCDVHDFVALTRALDKVTEKK